MSDTLTKRLTYQDLEDLETVSASVRNAKKSLENAYQKVESAYDQKMARIYKNCKHVKQCYGYWDEDDYGHYSFVKEGTVCVKCTKILRSRKKISTK